MKQISFWASSHKKAAITSVVILKLLLVITACYLGIMLAADQLFLPLVSINFAVLIIAIIAMVFYPTRKSQLSKASSYAIRKSLDFILAAASFVFFTCVSNNGDAVIRSVSNNNANAAIGIRPASAEEILAALKSGEKTKLTHKEKRVLKKEFFKQSKIYAISKIKGDQQQADHSLAIILTIIGAVGLLVLLTALVCNISCSGAEGAAVIVGILGLVGIVFLTVAVVKRIKRGPKNKDSSKE